MTTNFAVEFLMWLLIAASIIAVLSFKGECPANRAVGDNWGSGGHPISQVAMLPFVHLMSNPESDVTLSSKSTLNPLTLAASLLDMIERAHSIVPKVCA